LAGFWRGKGKEKRVGNGREGKESGRGKERRRRRGKGEEKNKKRRGKKKEGKGKRGEKGKGGIFCSCDFFLGKPLRHSARMAMPLWL